MQKTRPCVIVSPDEMNRRIGTVIIAPLTSQRRTYPTRVACSVGGKQDQVVLDQLLTVDTSRLVRRLGRLEDDIQSRILTVLQEMFTA